MHYQSGLEVGKCARLLRGDGIESGLIVDRRHAEYDGIEFRIQDEKQDLGWHRSAFLRVIRES